MKRTTKVFAVVMCALMLLSVPMNCFAATYDTNSAVDKYSTSGNNPWYFEDRTYVNVVRALAVYHESSQLVTIARVTLGANPRYQQFDIMWGQSVYYNWSGVYEQPTKNQTVTIQPNQSYNTTRDQMYVDYSSNWNVKKVLGWYNCQPYVLPDNHYCIITAEV